MKSALDLISVYVTTLEKMKTDDVEGRRLCLGDYETIEELPFEFLIKHYNENRIEDKITEEQLNLYSNLKEEVFKESINELLNKKEYIKNDKKIYFKDFKTFFETVLGYMYGLGGIKNR